MSGTYFEEGNCEVCGTVYDKYAEQRDNDPSSNIGRYTGECPNCGYNPNISGHIKSVLENSDENIIIKNGRIKINSEKLSGKLLEIIIENWPKSQKKN
jgi:hypothetical protein